MWIGTGPLPGSSRAWRARRSSSPSPTRSRSPCRRRSATRAGRRRGRLAGPTSSAPTIVMTSSDSSRPSQALARRRRQHLLRVLQDAGAAHDPAGGNVDAHVEPAEVVVELGRAEVEARVPAAQVVVLRDAREPLRRLEQRVVPSAASCGDRVRSGRRAASCATRCPASRSTWPATGFARRDTRERLIEAETAAWAARPGPVRRRPAEAACQVHDLAVDREARDDHPFRVLGRHRVPRGTRPRIDVVIQPQEDLGERLRAVVVQRDRLGAR